MKKILLLIVVGFIAASSFGQNIGALLSPVPGSEVYEYVQVKYMMEIASEKIQNVSISNGVVNDRVNRDFKSIVELYNFLGRAGWTYINETRKEDKSFISYSVMFSRKISFRGMNPPQRANQPEEKSQEPSQK